MIQHAGEAQFSDHTEDTVDLFGPKGQYNHLVGEDEMRSWYRRHKRDVIDRKKQKTNSGPVRRSREELKSYLRVLQGVKR